jgi:hypothetical protein
MTDDRLTRIRDTYERGVRRGLHDASEVVYVLRDAG